MRKLLFIILAAGFISMPFIAYGETPQGKTPPPISQALVREGDFAVRLAEILDIAKTKDEAEAEEALGALGIAPKNGWISDFPVTPDILAEIRASIAAAAEQGKLDMDRDDADAEFLALTRELGLPILAASEKGDGKRGYVTGEKYAEEGAAPEGGYDYQPPTVINNYYYEQGPPVVTYYPPPPDYAYLYAWDPFPFWWNTFFFPGFFVLRDFTVPVVINNRGGTVNIDGGKVIVRGGTVNATGSTVTTRTKLVTNRIIDRSTKRVVRVNPVTRTVVTGRGTETVRTFNADSARNIFSGRAARAAGDIGTRGGNIRNAQGRDGRVITGSQTRGGFNPAPSLRGRDTGNIGTGQGRITRGSRGFDPAPSLRGNAGRFRSSDNVQAPAPASPSFRGRGAVTGRSFDPAPSLKGRAAGGAITRGFDPAPSMRGNRFAPSATPPSVTRGNSAFGGGGAGIGRTFSRPSAPSFSAPGRSFGSGGVMRGSNAPAFGGGGRSFGGSGGSAFGGRGGGRR